MADLLLTSLTIRSYYIKFNLSASSLFDLVVVVLACVLVRASSDCPGTSSDAQGQDHQEVLRDLAWEVLPDLSW